MLSSLDIDCLLWSVLFGNSHVWYYCKNSEFESNRKHSIQKKKLYSFHLTSRARPHYDYLYKKGCTTLLLLVQLFSSLNIKWTYRYQFNLDLNFKRRKFKCFNCGDDPWLPTRRRQLSASMPTFNELLIGSFSQRNQILTFPFPSTQTSKSMTQSL